MAIPPIQNFIAKVTSVTAVWLNAVDLMLHGAVPAAGVYEAPFLAGQVQYKGADGNLASSSSFWFGTALPNASGIPAPGILLGGFGATVRAVIVTDQSVQGTAGIDLIIAAGETASSGTDAGGNLFLFGGASFGGFGGNMIVQGGTSLNGPGGALHLQGGNSTGGIPGDVFVSGGLNGTQGSNVHLIMTLINGIAGAVVIRVNSVVLWTINQFGAVFFGATGAGNPGDKLISGGPNASPAWGDGVQRGSFGFSLVGGFSANPTGVMAYETDGFSVNFTCAAGCSGNSVTNNDVTIVGTPGFLLPPIDRFVYTGQLQNGGGNGNSGECDIQPLTSGGGIIISLLLQLADNVRIGTGGKNAWTAASQKGLAPGFSISFTK